MPKILKIVQKITNKPRKNNNSNRNERISEHYSSIDKEQLNSVLKENESLKDKVSKLETEVIDNLELNQDNKRLKQEIEKLKIDNKLREEIENDLLQNTRKLNYQLETEKKDWQVQKQQLLTKQQELLTDKNKKIEELKTQLWTKNREFDEVRRKNEEIQYKLNSKEAELAKASKEKNDWRTRYTRQTSLVLSYEKKITKTVNLPDDWKEQLEQIPKLKEEINRLQKTFFNELRMFSELKKEKQSWQQREEEFLTKKNKKINALKETIQYLVQDKLELKKLKDENFNLLNKLVAANKSIKQLQTQNDTNSARQRILTLIRERDYVWEEKSSIQHALDEVRSENYDWIKRSVIWERRLAEAEKNLQLALEQITENQNYIEELRSELLSGYNQFSTEYASAMEDFYKRQGVNTGDYREHLQDYSFFKKFKEEISQNYLELNRENRELKQANEELEEQVKATFQLREVEFKRLKEIEFREMEAKNRSQFARELKN